MKEIGAEIQNARLEKGIDLEEIVRHTHIQLAHLQKIENGQFDFLPRPYVTAFIKTYAQYVGLNGEALVSRWREQEQAEKQQLQQMQETAQKKPEARKTAAAAPLKPRALATASSASLPIAIPYLKEVLISFGILATAVLIFFISRSGNEQAQTPPNHGTQSVKTEDSSQLQEIPFEQVSQQAQQRAELKPEPLPPAANELTMQAQFENQTRLRVVRDGKDTTITVSRAGETKSWQAKEKFNLRISAGGGVTLTLSGNNLGRFGQVGKIEYLTIKREGITEKYAIAPQPSKSRAAVPLDSVAVRRPRR
jgi:cytoskeletal protein RodZ